MILSLIMKNHFFIQISYLPNEKRSPERFNASSCEALLGLVRLSAPPNQFFIRGIPVKMKGITHIID